MKSRAGLRRSSKPERPVPQRVRLRETYGEGLWKQSHSFTVGEPLRMKSQSVLQGFLSLILPRGYPNSVSPDYTVFQIWDTVQGLSSYLRGILCQQSLMTGFGVGNASASVTSAALSWTLLSGMSMLGGVLFAFRTSSDIGANPKRWRLFADCMNDVGLTLTMAAPLAGDLFLLVACLGAICSAVCGVAAGASKASITQHFVKQRGNSALISDIYSKEGTQETIVSLLGLALGSGLSLFLQSQISRWMVFIALTLLHIVANYIAVTSLCLSTLNDQRASILIRHFARFNKVLTPGQVASKESVWGWNTEPAIKLGVPLHSIVTGQSSYEWLSEQLAGHHQAPPYLISLQPDQSAQVLIHRFATPLHVLQAYFESHFVISIGTKHAQLQTQTEEAFHLFIQSLKEKQWTLEEIHLTDERWRCEWT